MNSTMNEKVAELLEKVSNMIDDKISPVTADMIKNFGQQFYQHCIIEDLLQRDPIDLYGALMTYWNFIHYHTSNKPKVWVYNPSFEEQGWQSTHTIVSILTGNIHFLVDSMRMALNHKGLTVHLVIHPIFNIQRRKTGELLAILDCDEQEEGNEYYESILHIEIDKQTEVSILEEITVELEKTLADMHSVVHDRQAMYDRLMTIIDNLDKMPPPVDKEELAETKAFLHWLGKSHFTFLGYREYYLENQQDENILRIVPDSGLGILSHKIQDVNYSKSFARLPQLLRRSAQDAELLLLTKASSRATIHRPVYMDYVGIRQINTEGKVTGEQRFLGLYTSNTYHSKVRDIPILRQKVQYVIAQAGYKEGGHHINAILNILESYPRDELFQIDADQLYAFILSILQLQERQRIRLLVRTDFYGRFSSCLIYVPRDRYDTTMRERVQAVLVKAFNASSIDMTVLLSESPLAQVHFILHTPSGSCIHCDPKVIEAQLIEAAKTWADKLQYALVEHIGEERGIQLFRRYEEAFSMAYREQLTMRHAVRDIDKIETLPESQCLGMILYRPMEAFTGLLRFRLFHSEQQVSLSKILPILENMGVSIVNEKSYEVRPKDSALVWIQDFGLEHGEMQGLEIGKLRGNFQTLFAQAWHGKIENDSFNQLALKAELNWREIVIFRAYCKYLRQISGRFSQHYMRQAIVNNPKITTALLDLFYARFDPILSQKNPDISAKYEKIERLLDMVESLDEDRILRRFFTIIMATLRTNYFQRDGQGELKSYLSFKFDPHKIPDCPEPRPMFEIFVYSPKVEGVHLRGGKVARGGLRWSDRQEDFRTEILGLVKAQMVKNAVIVPVGSKGGFVVKRPPKSPQATPKEVIECYETFIRGLLDLTDNLIDDKIVNPKDTICLDDPDPYLVVAADKGTARFSDTANAIAREYHYWLDDAFASGGSAGYDHKAMGITARGAWESVKRHFRQLGRDTQAEDFTVIGIGGMSGDVFGNGMLLSPHIQLVGAFNHNEIFIDPNPDAQISFEERKRLFHLEHSGWSDYNPSLISKGGGVYSRSSKSIRLSTEAQAILQVTTEVMPPNELIRALLCAPVDLLWNGGIGTYVKHQKERHTDVGDRANDSLRIDGRELRCKVVAEGGNLGFTQLGRVEYAINNGYLHTDAIDNSAGVDCSDHEVNIKILLNTIVNNGDMTVKQRNQLLAQMTEDVAKAVLRHNYLQTQAIYLALTLDVQLLDIQSRFIQHLEHQGKLDRVLENLPSDKNLKKRRAEDKGLTSPEISVLLAYSKITLYEELLASDLPDDPYLKTELEAYFPETLAEQYAHYIGQHRLRREIIVNMLTNKVVNYMGSAFVFSLTEETNLSSADIVRAFTIAWHVFNTKTLWTAIERLDNQVPAEVQYRMMLEMRKLIERATRWFLRNCRSPLNIAETITAFRPGVTKLSDGLLYLIPEQDRILIEQSAHDLMQSGVPTSLSTCIASLVTWLSALSVVKSVQETSADLRITAALHFKLGTELKLHWLRDKIVSLPRNSRWNALARSALRDELYQTHRALTTAIVKKSGHHITDSDKMLSSWKDDNQASVDRWLHVFSDLDNTQKLDLPMLSVALREVRGLL